ncbi:hypothetical protein GCM10009627_18380 [Curtobacterium herbarum]|uniref:GNAT family N-acetyltransferase n=1 Tax=Curtobacterium herbarum TaxID=150122 RepID=A0ABP4K433_9MICO
MADAMISANSTGIVTTPTWDRAVTRTPRTISTPMTWKHRTARRPKPSDHGDRRPGTAPGCPGTAPGVVVGCGVDDRAGVVDDRAGVVDDEAWRRKGMALRTISAARRRSRAAAGGRVTAATTRPDRTRTRTAPRPRPLPFTRPAYRQP